MKLALAQLEISGVVRRNLASMCATIRAAAAQAADVVVFPESSLTGYLGISLDSLDALDMPEIHRSLGELQTLCRELQIAAVSGQYFKRCGRWYNNVVFIGADGELRGSYDKCHLVDQDTYHVAPGADPPAVFEFAGARVSLGVCHDIRYPEHVRWAAINGAQVHFHVFYGGRHRSDVRDQQIYDAHLATRAAENGVFLVAPNVAIDEQMVRSQVRDPIGHLVARAESWSETVVLCEIDPAIAGDGWVAKRRGDLYAFHPHREAPASYFERAVWEKKRYMLDHERSLLGSPSGATHFEGAVSIPGAQPTDRKR